jgi:hypothetical protein
MRQALGGRRFDKYNITADAFAELPRRIVFLREPRGRIESAWRIYSAGFRTRYCHRLGSLSEFVLAVSSDHLGDPHVAVAFEQCCHDGTFLHSSDGTFPPWLRCWALPTCPTPTQSGPRI